MNDPITLASLPEQGLPTRMIRGGEDITLPVSSDIAVFQPGKRSIELRVKVFAVPLSSLHPPRRHPPRTTSTPSRHRRHHRQCHRLHHRRHRSHHHRRQLLARCLARSPRRSHQRRSRRSPRQTNTTKTNRISERCRTSDGREFHNWRIRSRYEGDDEILCKKS